jgi:hypothetical protein
VSIIYEALKKVERNFRRAPKAPAPEEKKSPALWLAIVAVCLGFVGCGIAIALLVSSLGRPMEVIQKNASVAIRDTTSSKPRTAAAALPSFQFPSPLIPSRQKISDSLDLKGIMDAEGERIALINSEILRVGDYVNGARVIKITKNSVELIYKDKIIILKIK